MQYCYVEPQNRFEFQLRTQFYAGVIVIVLYILYRLIQKCYEKIQINKMKKIKEGNDIYE